jgi:Ca-activated chloride channel homolog
MTTNTTLPTLLIAPRRNALLAGHDNELDVLVRVQAPNAPAEQPSRNPLHLALVIDRSGSMSGQPLDEAKRCAEFVLDGLLPTIDSPSSCMTTAWKP